MKKTIITLITILIATSFVSTTHAFYQSFWPEDRSFEVSVPHVVLSFENGVQTTIIQPTFNGTADSFALVTVVPGEPTVVDVDPAVVENLQTSTQTESVSISNVNISYTNMQGGEEFKSIPVSSKPRYHNDYEVSFFPTSSIEEVSSWLDEQNYAYQPQDIQALAEYQNIGGYYFVIIHVDVAETAAYDDEGFFGTLSPIALEFTHLAPYLPLSVMNTNEELNPITMEVYLVSPQYFYIPGVNTLFSEKLSTEALEFSSPEEPWIVRQRVVFDPRLSTQDLYMNNDDEGYTIDPGTYRTRTINPQYRRTETGIQQGTAPSTDEPVETFDTLQQGTKLLTYGVRGEAVQELQLFLNRELSLNLATDGIWGDLTHEAVEQFQSQHELLVDGIIGNQTRSYISQIIGSE